MADRVRWFDRRWTFDFPAANYADVLERLRGTPARLEERLARAPAGRLTGRAGAAWSLQENVGHLLDVEELWVERTRQFLAGEPELRAADVTNRRTHEAGHDAAALADLLARFRAARFEWLATLESAPPETFARAARHPRLATPMRLVDLCVFVADHDDHHLATMGALLARN